MDVEQLRHQIGTLLSTEFERTDALAEVLGDSRKVFAGRDVEAIERAAAEIQRLVAEVEASERHRQKVLSAIGLAPGKDGMEQFLDRLDRDGHLHELWQRLLKRAEECQRLNQANAMAVEANRQYAEAALRILRGQSANPETYTRPGHAPATGASSRALGKA